MILYHNNGVLLRDETPDETQKRKALQIVEQGDKGLAELRQTYLKYGRDAGTNRHGKFTLESTIQVEQPPAHVIMAEVGYILRPVLYGKSCCITSYLKFLKF